MELKFIIRLTCIIYVFVNSSSSFSQQKPIIKDTVVEEIVYEYDTIFVNDIKIRIDTLHSPKSKSYLLDVTQPKFSILKSKLPELYSPNKKVSVSVLFGLSAFSAQTSSFENKLVNGNALVQDVSFFPSVSYSFAYTKSNWVYSFSFEYRTYSEVLMHTMPLNWSDTLDNGSEIFYRSIDGQLKSEIKNQYRFLHLNTAFGYRLGTLNFSVIPQAIIGAGFGLSQQNYLLDTLALKVVEINSVNKTGLFFTLGASCLVGYSIKKNISLYLKPEWQNFFINENVHPITYRNIFGINFIVAFSFRTN
jgi:hypothetical protein